MKLAVASLTAAISAVAARVEYQSLHREAGQPHRFSNLEKETDTIVFSDVKGFSVRL